LDLLLEIGCEELPAEAVYSAIAQLERAVPRMLTEARLEASGGVRVAGTPRRLIAVVEGLPPASTPEEFRKKGPPLSAARRDDGSWSKSALGFARSQGVEPDDLAIEETDKGSYVFAVVREEGDKAAGVLPDRLADIVRSLHFDRSMRWGNGEQRFSRPIRWIVAMLDTDVLPFEYAGLESGSVTRGHRFLSEGPVRLSEPSEYEETLRKEGVVADHEERRRLIVENCRNLCHERNMEPVLNEEVLREVVQLVELPGTVLGDFDARFLELPVEVLTHAMEDHQRYFPVEGQDGRLTSAFVAVHNGDPGFADEIRKGHERVLAARLADARFFYDEDLKRPLPDRLEDLDHVVYQSELGSMAEKSSRLEQLTCWLASEMGVDEGTTERARRAAELSKCDLVTHVVGEFPALQGVMGKIYALAAGEEDGVARAIYEQYLPRRPGDELPGGEEGVLLSLSEKADNLASSFGLGHIPTGSEDPYALRRQVLGILLVLLDREIPASVAEIVRQSARALEKEAHGFTWSADAEAAFMEFFVGRESVFFIERGYRYDLVDAVLAIEPARPLAARRRMEALGGARETGLLARMYTAFERCYNLSRGHPGVEVDAALLVEDEEREVFERLEAARESVGDAVGEMDFERALQSLEPLTGPVDRLFDEVLIMSDEEEVRENRLSLISGVAELFNRIADFTLLAWD
jgi:glycyl-tRNA synthetase beta chain